METQNTYESQLTQKQFPLMRLELVIDQLTNLLGEVKDDVLKGSTSRNYPTLIKTYLNVLIRTKNIRENNPVDYMLKRGEHPSIVVSKIEDYLGFLESKGIYSLGKEDFNL